MDDTLKTKFASLGPWLTGFTVDGVKYGGDYLPETDFRLNEFVARNASRLAGIPGGGRILECGCFEGGHTALLAQNFAAAQIVAVEVRPENLRKAALLAEIKGCRNIAFRVDDLEEPAACLQEKYDAIFCVGLLYHLRRPDVFLKRAAQAAPYLWLWTVYCAEAEVTFQEAGFRGRIYGEPVEHPLSGVRRESFFPTLGSLTDMLWDAGYKDVNLVRREMTLNGNGPAILLEASR